MNSSQEIPALRKLGHDLNNVWAVLLGNAELMEMMLESDSPLRQYVEEMIAAIEHGEAITTQVRAIAHGESPEPPTGDTATANTHPATDSASDDPTDTSQIILGCRVIDDDHRQLEQKIHQLLELNSAADANRQINDLFTLSLHHFYREEQLALHCPDYPFAANHHQTHCALLARLQHLQKMTERHGLNKKVLVELADLLTLHILGMDAMLIPYVTEQPALLECAPTLPIDTVLYAYFDLPAPTPSTNRSAT